MGVEPTGDGGTRRPPVLKTGTITGPHALPRKPKGIPFQRLADVGRRTLGLLPSFEVLDMIIASARRRTSHRNDSKKAQASNGNGIPRERSWCCRCGL